MPRFCTLLQLNKSAQVPSWFIEKLVISSPWSNLEASEINKLIN